MTLSNAEVAGALELLADLLEIESANPFRVRAYRNAARTVVELPDSLAAMLDSGQDLARLPGIGEDLASKLTELVRTERLPLLEEIKARTPAGLVGLLRIPGLGPKRVHLLHDALGIGSPEDLAAALAEGRLHGLHGFGPKTEQHLREELQRRGSAERRLTLLEAEGAALPLIAQLETMPGVDQVEVAGSYRRRRETVGDLDLVAAASEGKAVIERFVALPQVAKVVAQGKTRATVRLRTGVQVDLRAVENASYGAALLYFTGSKAHNIALRAIAARRGWKLNEYGLFAGRRRIAAKTERDIYKALGLAFVPPELREDRGEIASAAGNAIPELIEPEMLKGDLHVHSDWSDGRTPIAEMAHAARALGLEYLAICDHSKRVTIAHGLNEKQLLKQIEEIDRLNNRLSGFTVLKSTEVDILADGRLDLPDRVLARLDLTVCSIHSAFNLSQEEQTRRILNAMDNPHFKILGHPSGRLINQRQGYALDYERVLEGARERSVVLEVNAQPDRLDLDDVHCRMAVELGVKLAISTDAHRPAELAWLRFGVGQARRGWVSPDLVINTRAIKELRKLLRR
ncbi:MAG TPA: DNA polymerase/3'-5' exonuclease PolX [Alphaproteobacteria bacterium]|nr:DNA polymerase/3'-5' exonuclease PolX [Alphaproteobacteria bacterium]